jgi:cephalosporin hydroxylase
MSGFRKRSEAWLVEGFRQQHAYNFEWMGVPIVQLPADMMRLQQIVWETQPDLIIETGTNRGGSAIFFASLLDDEGYVITIDKKPKWVAGDAFDRHHLRKKKVRTIKGNSTEEAYKEVKQYVEHNPRHEVMVFLDSSHGAKHVAKELKLYSPFVSKGCYLVVADGVTEMLPEHTANPAAAARDFAASSPNFVEQHLSTDKHPFVTYCQDGYLKRIK